ncbi:flavodoxin [Xanthomonas campestris pv. raphani]|uniref:flavodoxin n=1 Tax=Xanthomonas campestris TaxID=339 RepID=UPI002B225CFE|nr:flavodoxin [Xanthomonas campestris]MEA9653317.1 flavodoxin [Xanthomonas campestris pv. raphani]MEB2109941.1 flavodoxin [Xanthomonas campestris pv. campestris]
MRILLALASLSGNTRDVARMISARCAGRGFVTDWIETDRGTLADVPRTLSDYDLFLLGSWTDNGGRTPTEMKRFIVELVETLGKPPQVAVFGTGETQWGEDYFCGAVHRIARFFESPFPRLTIEQMPHGVRDAHAIAAWTDEVLAQCKNDPHDADHYRHVA